MNKLRIVKQSSFLNSSKNTCMGTGHCWYDFVIFAVGTRFYVLWFQGYMLDYTKSISTGDNVNVCH